MKANRKRKPLEPYLLSGLVQCAACGSPIVGSRAGGGHRYYCCSRKRENCCKCGLRVDETEAAVLSTMRQAAINMDEKRMREIFSSMLVPHQVDSKQLESDLRRELAECRGRQRKLIEALETGAVTADMVGGRLRELKDQEGGLAERIATCQLEADARVGCNEKEFSRFLVAFREQLEGLRGPMRLIWRLPSGIFSELNWTWKQEKGSCFTSCPSLTTPGR